MKCVIIKNRAMSQLDTWPAFQEFSFQEFTFPVDRYEEWQFL